MRRAGSGGWSCVYRFFGGWSFLNCLLLYGLALQLEFYCCNVSLLTASHFTKERGGDLCVRPE